MKNAFERKLKQTQKVNHFCIHRIQTKSKVRIIIITPNSFVRVLFEFGAISIESLSK